MRLIVLLIISFAFSSAVSSSALAGNDRIVISTGKDRGSYFYIGKRLASELAVAHGIVARVDTSRGSLDNLSLLANPDSPVNVAFTQADALGDYLSDFPSFEDAFFVLGDVGRECALIIAGKKGIARAQDLKEGKGEIAVDGPTSGASATWNNMTRLEPSFGATSPVPVSIDEALIQLRDGSAYTKLRAAMIVQRPKRTSPALETLMGDSESFRLIPIRAADLANARLPDGREIYTFERVIAGGKQRRNNIEVETLCTRGLMLGSKHKMSRERRGQLSTLMLEARDRIVLEDE